MRWLAATICLSVCAACSILLVAPSLSQPPAPQPRERTLLFVGDVMLSRAVGARMQSEGDWTFPFTEIGETLATADLTFGNLECPVSDVGRNRHHLYSFRADPRAVEGLNFAGFDVLSVANNHMYDWGPDALLDTVRRLREAGIHTVGAGANDLEAHYPVLVDLGGLRIAFLAYVNIDPKEAAAAPDRPGVAWLEPERVLADIRFARPLADLVVVGLHWGVEYATRPGRDQIELAHQMIDAGADLVVGGHPHVVQPMEEYQGRWIAYSLGNFVFDQKDPATRRAVMLKVTTRGKQIDEVTATPIQIDRSFRAVLAPVEEKPPKPLEAKARVEGSSLGAR
jgi:poly-gamma-glutamate synthesis protein (capsule biosynthesis protein)